MREQIVSSGKVTLCSFCKSEENPTIELEELAEQVHSVLEEHFYMTSSEPEGIDYLAAKEGCWEQAGEPITYAIMNLNNSSEELAEAIREYLSERYDPAGKDALIDPCPYDTESQYEERAIDTYEFQESWTSFRHEILSRSRFFNQAAKSALEHLFSGIEQLETYEDKPVVRVFSTTDSIFRARVAKTDGSLERILKDAPRSLGAPPGRYASASRMNAEGISVFYGASDADTCIAEIRAPVGSTVVIGEFNPVRDLRLLDLTRLDRVFLQGSLFDPTHTELLTRVHFLKRLVEELSHPVMPGVESRDYLPTQVVAEYLSLHPDMQLDGVMFSSSQIISLESTGSDSDVPHLGKNIVLFFHACGLEQYDIPSGTKIDVHQSWDDPDDPDHTIIIREEVPDSSEKKEQSKSRPGGFDWEGYVQPPAVVDEHLEVSIRLDIRNIKIRKIEGLSYQTSTINVSRHRTDSKESDF